MVELNILVAATLLNSNFNVYTARITLKSNILESYSVCNGNIEGLIIRKLYIRNMRAS